jgi:hypothetical protein
MFNIVRSWCLPSHGFKRSMPHYAHIRFLYSPILPHSCLRKSFYNLKIHPAAFLNKFTNFIFSSLIFIFNF